MIKRRLLPMTAFAGTALLILTACGNSDTQARSSTTAAPSSVSSSPASSGSHNDEDVTFAQNMVGHHQQAIQMSDIILAKQGIDPRVIDLANQIKAAQSPEIQQMQAWLSQWGQPTMPSSMAPATSMPGMPGHSGTPGMMSEQDMEALRNAQGLDASKLFLTQMIQHHQGAITMAQHEIHSGQYSPAITLAQSVVTNQQQEINTMQTILSSL